MVKLLKRWVSIWNPTNSPSCHRKDFIHGEMYYCKHLLHNQMINWTLTAPPTSTWGLLPLRWPWWDSGPRIRTLPGYWRRRSLWWRWEVHIPLRKRWLPALHLRMALSGQGFDGPVSSCIRLHPLPGCCPRVRPLSGPGPLQRPRCSHVPPVLVQKPRHLRAATGRCPRHPVPLRLVLCTVYCALCTTVSTDYFNRSWTMY